MPDEGGGSIGLVRWIVQGGAWAALAAWLGVQQKQMNAMQQHGENVRKQHSREHAGDIDQLRQRVAANEQAITEIRQKAVTKDDLDHVAERLEQSMNRGFSEVRQEIGQTHRRVDDVMRDRARENHEHYGEGEGSR